MCDVSPVAASAAGPPLVVSARAGLLVALALLLAEVLPLLPGALSLAVFGAREGGGCDGVLPVPLPSAGFSDVSLLLDLAPCDPVRLGPPPCVELAKNAVEL